MNSQVYIGITCSYENQFFFINILYENEIVFDTKQNEWVFSQSPCDMSSLCNNGLGVCNDHWRCFGQLHPS